MGRLSKFEDVDVFASLNAVLKQNTGFYQSDFDIDKEIIAKAAAIRLCVISIVFPHLKSPLKHCLNRIKV